MGGNEFNNINEYGCWCYFEHDYIKGRGKPKNDVDRFCKLLHDGYECSISDGCPSSPWDVDYNTGTPAGLENLREECLIKNAGNECAQNVCITEGWFVLSLFQQFLSFNQHDSSLLHSNGFNVESQCKGGKGGNVNVVADESRQCCGEYPTRHPFRSNGGARSCCGSRTYEVGVFTCCPGNVVSITCP